MCSLWERYTKYDKEGVSPHGLFQNRKNGQRVVCDPITVWCDECAEIRENKREESK